MSTHTKSTPAPAPRQKRVSPSHPKLVAEGMDRLEPTELIDRAREKIREATRDASRPSQEHPLPKGV